MYLQKNKAAAFVTHPQPILRGNSQHQQKCRQLRNIGVRDATNTDESMRVNKMTMKPSLLIRNSRSVTFRSTLTPQDTGECNLALNLPKVLSSRSLSPEHSLKSFAPPECEETSYHVSQWFRPVGVNSGLPNQPRIDQQTCLMVRNHN